MDSESRIIKRIKEITSLKPGWLDNGEGSAIDKSYAKKVGFIILKISNITKCKSYIYPSVDGEIEVDWEANCWKFAVHFGLDEQIDLCAENTKTNDVLEKRFRFESNDVENFLAKLLEV